MLVAMLFHRRVSDLLYDWKFDYYVVWKMFYCIVLFSSNEIKQFEFEPNVQENAVLLDD